MCAVIQKIRQLNFGYILFAENGVINELSEYTYNMIFKKRNISLCNLKFNSIKFNFLFTNRKIKKNESFSNDLLTGKNMH